MFAKSVFLSLDRLYSGESYIMFGVCMVDICLHTMLDVCDCFLIQTLRILTVSLEGTVSLGVRLAVIAADIIAVIVNWRKAIGTVREASRLNIKVPLSMALIQNGTMLFLGLLGLNILEIVSNTVPNAQIVAPGNSLIAPLSSILMCRFMLNLKQVDSPGQSTGRSAHMSTIHFNSDLLVGNLGESLELGHEADELDLEVSDQIVEERPGDVERPGSSSHSGQ
ncbi:hypothetical protein BDY19DRAFT_398879 [Irpex rosettiformis]|uniref:Uncharacterized protein n=1 Tax=Irpex rosettiformis TaxID=378272 RepID=A0ACB8UFC2_9APHY|nr:hypothetical protein BDY19DRAFT_398879 [Irpex rosettiformis]